MGQIQIPGFLVYRSLLQGTRKLTDEELGRLFRAMMHYAFLEELPDLQGREAGTFDMVQVSIDADFESYRKRCAANAENGKKGGRPPKAKPIETEGNRKNPLGYLETEETQTNRKNLNCNSNSNCNCNSNNNPHHNDDDDFSTEAFARQREIDSIHEAAINAGFGSDQTTLYKLEELANQYPTDWILKAIDDSHEHGGKTLAYLGAVLRDYKLNGIENRKKPAPKTKTNGTPIINMEECDANDI